MSAPAVAGTAIPARARPTAPSAVGLLTATLMRAGAREGQFVFAAVSPVIFFVCLYVPLHRRFEAAGVDYATYLTPVIMLQGAMFAAIVSAEVAGAAARDGLAQRLASIPIRRIDPLLARLSGAALRTLIAIAGAAGIGAVFGFRMHTSVGQAVAFGAIPVAVALTLSLLTDSLATVVAHPDSIAQALMVPLLVVVMLSTGLVPAEYFPDWIQPFVNHQPVSLSVDAMRALAGGDSAAVGELAVWFTVLAAVGIVAARWAAQREVRQ